MRVRRCGEFRDEKQPHRERSRITKDKGKLRNSEFPHRPAPLWPINVPYFLPPPCLTFGVHYILDHRIST